MDPNLWELDWNRTFEVLGAVIVLSFLVERVTALVVESRWFVASTRTPDPESPEAKRESQRFEQADKALDLVRDLETAQSATDAAAIKKGRKNLDAFLKSLDASSPLWPPPEPGLSQLDTLRLRALNSIERARERQDRRERLKNAPIKEGLALVVAAGVCIATDFDAFAIIMLTQETSLAGAFLTGAVVAGGSKASIKLFHDVLGVRSGAVNDARKATGKDSKS